MKRVYILLVQTSALSEVLLTKARRCIPLRRTIVLYIVRVRLARRANPVGASVLWWARRANRTRPSSYCQKGFSERKPVCSVLRLHVEKLPAKVPFTFRKKRKCFVFVRVQHLFVCFERCWRCSLKLRHEIWSIQCTKFSHDASCFASPFQSDSLLTCAWT